MHRIGEYTFKRVTCEHFVPACCWVQVTFIFHLPRSLTKAKETMHLEPTLPPQTLTSRSIYMYVFFQIFYGYFHARQKSMALKHLPQNKTFNLDHWPGSISMLEFPSSSPPPSSFLFLRPPHYGPEWILTPNKMNKRFRSILAMS